MIREERHFSNCPCFQCRCPEPHRKVHVKGPNLRALCNATAPYLYSDEKDELTCKTCIRTANLPPLRDRRNAAKRLSRLRKKVASQAAAANEDSGS